MLPEYDFTGGERGKYAKHYASGTNVVLLSPDVAEAFPNAGAVNNALRALVNIARQMSRQPNKAGATTNNGRTRRCTRPPTAPFVPHYASGGG